MRRIYRQGVIVNVFNPKTALFFLAFLPQFVDRGSSIPPQVAVLGITFAAIAFASDCLYALLADLLAGRLRRGGARARGPALSSRAASSSPSESPRRPRTAAT